MNVSFSGHAHLFDQTINTNDISNTPCSHVYLKEYFFTHLIGLSEGSVY